MDKSILEMVHSTAQDLHQAGVMKGITLRGFDALCLPSVQEPIKRGSRGKTSGRVRGIGLKGWARVLRQAKEPIEHG